MIAASNPTYTRRRRGAGSLLFALLALCLLIVGSTAAYAAAPAAGTSIGNQASATYTDGSGTSRTVTSNTVQTVVQQVASLTLSSNGNKSAAVGSTVYYSHTLTNTGNGTDTFALTSASASSNPFVPSSITIYPDANGTGVPSGPAITSSAALAAGATFQFIVAVVVPGTATSGQTNVQTVTATSGFNTDSLDVHRRRAADLADEHTREVPLAHRRDGRERMQRTVGAGIGLNAVERGADRPIGNGTRPDSGSELALAARPA